MLYGGLDNDLLSGGIDDDVLFGVAGRNVLPGGSCDDVLTGGDGNDFSFGGQGRDTFAYNQVSEFGDVIQNFEIVRDRIDLSAIIDGNASFGSSVTAEKIGNHTMILAGSDQVTMLLICFVICFVSTASFVIMITLQNRQRLIFSNLLWPEIQK